MTKIVTLFIPPNIFYAFLQIYEYLRTNGFANYGIFYMFLHFLLKKRLFWVLDHYSLLVEYRRPPVDNHSLLVDCLRRPKYTYR